MQYQVSEDGTRTPQYRFKLKGMIHSKGFKWVNEFAKVTGEDNATISRIINGWEWPSPRVQTKLADALGITLRELQTLL